MRIARGLLLLVCAGVLALGFALGCIVSRRGLISLDAQVHMGDLLQVGSTLLIGMGVAVFFTWFQNSRQKQEDIIVAFCKDCQTSVLSLEQHVDRQWSRACEEDEAHEILHLLRKFTNSYDLLKNGLAGSSLRDISVSTLSEDIQALREEVTEPLSCHRTLEPKAITGKIHKCKQSLNAIIFQVYRGPL